MKNLIKACIAMAAFAAIFVVPSVASATSPELTHPTGSTVPVGTNIIATNVAHSTTSEITKFTNNLGATVECQTATLTGKVITNTGTHIVGEITTAEFKNKTSSTCSSELGNVTVTPSHTSIPCHTPTGSTQRCTLPLCITASNLKDEFEVFGQVEGDCDNGKKGPIFFTLDTVLAGPCSYERAAALVGTYTTHPADAILTVTPGQTLNKVTGGGFCPSSGSLDMAFTMTTDVEGIEKEPIYIS